MTRTTMTRTTMTRTLVFALLPRDGELRPDRRPIGDQPA
jgi:hypothetical protein